MRIEIVKTRPRHVVDLVSNMRADDAAELSMLGASPREAWNQYSHSVLSRTLEIDGRVAVVWGLVGDMFGGMAELWMLTTPEIERAPKAFVRRGEEQVEEFLTLYNEIGGVFPASYRGARRYAETLGFTIVEGEPFCAFYKERI